MPVPPFPHMPERQLGAREFTKRAVALACWCYAVWLLLTATLTLEQLLFGAVISTAVGCVLAPLGEVAGPWRLLRPRAFIALVALLATALGRMLLANLRLAKRVWSPSLPLADGMVIVSTRERTAAGLTAVGLITSSIVDNQIVDLDPERGELQYHAVDVTGMSADTPERNREGVNAPIERRLRAFRKDRDD